jgi:CRISPR/Cas system CSM-associated protein Csm2 small subunit
MLLKREWGRDIQNLSKIENVLKEIIDEIAPHFLP